MLSLGINLSSLHADDNFDRDFEQRHLNCQERVDEWTSTLRDFREKHSKKCCGVDDYKVKLEEVDQKFITNSSYTGQRNMFGMNGKGTYTFPNGIKYTGSFKDDLFDGNGNLEYPDDVMLEGTWFSGLMTDPKLYLYEDYLYNFDDWAYCEMPDRRFKIEHDSSIPPPDKSYLTNSQPTRQIPDGYYDSGDGFYSEVTQFVYKYDDLSTIIRKPSRKEHKWITENCRKWSDPPVGAHADLYEQFAKLQLVLEDSELKRGFSIASNHNTKFLERWQAMRSAMDIRHLRSKMVHQHHQNLSFGKLNEAEDAV